MQVLSLTKGVIKILTSFNKEEASSQENIFLKIHPIGQRGKSVHFLDKINHLSLKFEVRSYRDCLLYKDISARNDEERKGEYRFR